MKTEHRMTMLELINYVKLRNEEYASRPSAPEVCLNAAKKTTFNYDIIITFQVPDDATREKILELYRKIT